MIIHCLCRVYTGLTAGVFLEHAGSNRQVGLFKLNYDDQQRSLAQKPRTDGLLYMQMVLSETEMLSVNLQLGAPLA